MLMKKFLIILILFSSIILSGCNVPVGKPQSAATTMGPSEKEISLEKTVIALNLMVSEIKKTTEVTQILPTPTLEATATPVRFSNLCADSFVHDDVQVNFLGWKLDGNQNLTINMSFESLADQVKLGDDVYFFSLKNSESYAVKETDIFCPNRIWVYPHLKDVFSHKSNSLKGNYCYLLEGSSPFEFIFYEQKTNGAREVCSWRIDLSE